jgi:segregation and condensation protein B
MAMHSSRDDLPFQAVVPNPESEPAWDADEQPVDAAESDWSLAALEEAYQRALQSADDLSDQVELETPPVEESNQAVAEGVAVQTAEKGPSQSRVAETNRVTPEQVLEALLFVGGDPLTGRRLADLLGGETMSAQVDELVCGLNARYLDQCRPYQILPGEGGYRLTLHPDYESVRSRVYGLGPRDVRLSQDALEILALVAYQQPVDRATLEVTGKPNVAALVRQLLRLELITLERGDGGKDDIRYRTTARFLRLFALERLEELPHPEDLMFK